MGLMIFDFLWVGTYDFLISSKMRISINWLKDYINLKEKPQKVADALTLGIAEVENIEEQGKNLENIVVGKILEINRHPKADRLSVACVDVGKKKLRIIFSPIIKLKKGDMLPVALAPTRLPTGIEVKKIKIRGLISEGMFCLNSELEILNKAREVYFFNKTTQPGAKISKVLGLPDAILEIDNKSLTHRSDLFSHIGIARELSAILERKLKIQRFYINRRRISTRIEPRINIEIKDKKFCRRYMACVLDNIEVKESPDWLKSRLLACGIRPINNIVDITNYVMMEWGQPLHAFDFDKIESTQSKNKYKKPKIQNKKIIVRCAKKGEFITTIDGKKRQLDESMLVIADTKRPIAIAGVMGGVDTAVSKGTKTIILESANFDSVNCRMTSKRLGLRTEAVLRFEKNLGIDLTEKGLFRAVELFTKLASAEVVDKIYDIRPFKTKPKLITLNLEHLNKLVGLIIRKDQVIKILKTLEFKLKHTSANKLKVEVPLFRTDINIPEDLIEEVARIYGYGNIKPNEIVGVLKPKEEPRDLYWSKKIAGWLCGMGFSEVYNYSFYGASLLKKCKLSVKDHLELANPLSSDLRYLRTSLLPRLFSNAERNLRNFEEFRLFEIGHVYFPGFECKSLAGLILGASEQVFYQAKGAVELLLSKLNIDFKIEHLKKTEDCEYWHMYAEGKSVQFLSGKNLLGTLALLENQVLENFDIKKKEVAFFSLSLDQLARLATSVKKYTPIPKYPPVRLDLAFVLNRKIPASEVEKEMLKAGIPYLRKVELFDVYTGPPLAINEKNLAFHLFFQSLTKTLRDKEIRPYLNKIIQVLEKRFGAQIRA